MYPDSWNKNLKVVTLNWEHYYLSSRLCPKFKTPTKLSVLRYVKSPKEYEIMKAYHFMSTFSLQVEESPWSDKLPNIFSTTFQNDVFWLWIQEVTEVIASNAFYTTDKVMSKIHQREFTMIWGSNLYWTSIHTSCAIIFYPRDQPQIITRVFISFLKYCLTAAGGFSIHITQWCVADDSGAVLMTNTAAGRRQVNTYAI